MDETITAFYDGIEVMVLPKNSFLNKNGTPIAAIEKTDDRIADGTFVPKHVPFDNLSFANGQKCKAVKILRNMLVRKREVKKSKKMKTIKKSPITH
jgi:hypothetical protein